MVWMHQEQDIRTLRKGDVVDLACRIRRCYFKALADVDVGTADGLASSTGYRKSVYICNGSNGVEPVHACARCML